jgi:hypothetical protein
MTLLAFDPYIVDTRTNQNSQVKASGLTQWLGQPAHKVNEWCYQETTTC